MVCIRLQSGRLLQFVCTEKAGSLGLIKPMFRLIYCKGKTDQINADFPIWCYNYFDLFLLNAKVVASIVSCEDVR